MASEGNVNYAVCGLGCGFWKEIEGEDYLVGTCECKDCQIYHGKRRRKEAVGCGFHPANSNDE